MNLKKAAYYCFIMLLIASGQLFTSCSKENKTPQNNVASGREKRDYEKIKLSSKEFMQYCDLVITGDSSGIYVQKGDSVLYRHLMPKGYFAVRIVYDRMTGYISYNKCTTIGCEKGYWTYELKVWDFKRNKEWTFKNGKACEGEGNNSLTMINYNEKENTGVIVESGYGGSEAMFYKNGIEQKFDCGTTGSSIEAVLPNNEYIVSSSAEGESDGTTVKYSIENGKYTILNENDFLKYKDLTIKQFGHNYSAGMRDISGMYYINWNPQGTAYVALRPLKPGDYKNHSFCIYSDSKIYDLISDKETLIPIWK